MSIFEESSLLIIGLIIPSDKLQLRNASMGNSIVVFLDPRLTSWAQCLKEVQWIVSFFHRRLMVKSPETGGFTASFCQRVETCWICHFLGTKIYYQSQHFFSTVPSQNRFPKKQQLGLLRIACWQITVANIFIQRLITVCLV